jgi:Holliday junction resolvase-like predicted endonuclease
MKGEFDVLAVNYDQKVFLYVEVKSNARGYRKARDQLDRAETHFEDAGWDMIGQVWLED